MPCPPVYSGRDAAKDSSDTSGFFLIETLVALKTFDGGAVNRESNYLASSVLPEPGGPFGQGGFLHLGSQIDHLERHLGSWPSLGGVQFLGQLLDRGEHSSGAP